MYILRILIVTLSTISFANLAVGQEDAAAIPHRDGVVDDISVIFPPEAIEDGRSDVGSIIWVHNIRRLDASSIQIEIADRGTSPGSNAVVEFVDLNGEVHERISAADLSELDGYWTNHIPSTSVDIVVRGQITDEIAFELTGVAYEKSGFLFESIIGADQRQHLREYNGDFLLNNPGASGPIAKITYIKTDDTGRRARFNCTGWLVANDLLVTNQHCVSDQNTCSTTKALFGFEKNALGFATASDQFQCAEVLVAEYDADTALIRLDTSNPSTPGELYGTLRIAVEVPSPSQKLYIIQHPAGEAKQISDLDCEVRDSPVRGRAVGIDFSHSCDTLGGSSGSPVFNERGEVIGLHHLGKSALGRFSSVNRAVQAGVVLKTIADHLD